MIFWWFVYLHIFHVIFLEPLIVNAQFLTSLFLVLVYAYSSSFFAIIQLFSKLTSENSTKMFIKILKSISSYVYHCSLSLFIAAFKHFIGLLGASKRPARPSFPFFPFNSFKPEIDFVSKFRVFFHPVSYSIFALVCNLSPLISSCWLNYSCFLQTGPLILYTSRVYAQVIQCKY